MEPVSLDSAVGRPDAAGVTVWEALPSWVIDAHVGRRARIANFRPRRKPPLC